MGLFLDSWQSATPLERSELIPLLRAFTLAVFRTAASQAGLSPEAIARWTRRGQIQGDAYKQGNYDPVEGWKVYFKQFKETSNLFDRFVIDLDPPIGGDWCLAVRVNTETTGAGHRIKSIVGGLLRWGATPTGIEERLMARAISLSEEAGLTLTSSPSAEDEGRRWGAHLRLTEWTGSEELLIEHLGHLLATLLPLLHERRTWTVAEPRRFVSARFSSTLTLAEAVGQRPGGGSWELKLGERDARQLESHGTLIQASYHDAAVRLKLTRQGNSLANFTSCEGAFATIGDLGAAMGLRQDDRVWLLQEAEGRFTLERAPMPTLLVPESVIMARGAEGRSLHLAMVPRFGGRVRQWQNGLERGERVELFVTEGDRVTHRAQILHLVGMEELSLELDELEPYELAVDALRVADTWEPVQRPKGLVAVYERADAPAALRPPGAGAKLDPTGEGTESESKDQKAGADLTEILAAFAADPTLVYDPADLVNLVTALTALEHKHFVILHGPSGTGKSQFAQAYANAIHGRPLRSPENPYYKVVPVQPTWQDRGPLLGYFNPLTGLYEVPDFLAHLLRALADPAKPYILCLDEMNLAVAEHYFADFLSAWESREPITLHRQGSGLDLPEQVRIPPNFYVIGTVNIDETTHSFSPKVLDRAYTVELAGQDLSTVIDRLIDSYGEAGAQLRPVGDLLRELQAILAPEGLGFAYRTAQEILAFLAQLARAGWPIDRGEALDRILHQKILPKLRGDDRRIGALKRLDERIELALRETGANPEVSRSRSALNRMRESAERYGTFQFWR